MGGTIARLVSRWYSHAATVRAIFIFYAVTLFITSCVNDFKDVRRDLAAGCNARVLSYNFRALEKIPEPPKEHFPSVLIPRDVMEDAPGKPAQDYLQIGRNPESRFRTRARCYFTPQQMKDFQRTR